MFVLIHFDMSTQTITMMAIILITKPTVTTQSAISGVIISFATYCNSWILIAIKLDLKEGVYTKT